MNFQFVSAARSEYFDAINYYNDLRPGLGDAFAGEVMRSIGVLCEYPNSGVLISAGIRRSLVTRFPYAIIYTFQDGTLIIVSVTHEKRYPGHWRSRLKPR